MHILRYISLLLSLTVLLAGCAQELYDAPKPVVTDILPFSVSVQTSAETRASFDGGNLASGHYVFASGDALYISGGEGNIYGKLDLVSGVGTHTATFSGSLNVINDYTLTSTTELSATLVGTSQVAPNGSFYTIADERITSGPTYPASIAYTTSLAELVQKYSHFTAHFTYNNRQLTLNQQTAFLNFTLELYRSSLVLSGQSPTVQIDFKNTAGSVIRSVTGVPVGGNSTISQISFTNVFPADTSLRRVQTWINNNGGVHCEPDFAPGLELAANHYYHVFRSSIEDFTVEAPLDLGLGANVTFNNGPVECKVYRIATGTWSDWRSYDGTISLSAGEKVSFRGQKSAYTNTGGSISGNNNANLTTGTPMISVTNPVYIYGDIMSLICDANWVRQSTAGDNAFKYAFSGCANIDIPADKDLVLSAETLGTACYEGMFSACTNLTKVPILPVNTTLPNRAYYGMFRQCSQLVSPPDSLHATALGQEAYSQMFYRCTSLTSIPSFPSAPVTWNGRDVCFKMFFKCEALREVTDTLFKGTTTMGQGCFMDMFSECTNLDTVSVHLLPATTLATDCYRGMFQSTNIKRAPDLLVSTLASECYRYMFNSCKSLRNVKCLATTNIGNGYTTNWLGNVTNNKSCTFVRAGTTDWVRSAHGIPSNWEVIPPTGT